MPIRSLSFAYARFSCIKLIYFGCNMLCIFPLIASSFERAIFAICLYTFSSNIKWCTFEIEVTYEMKSLGSWSVLRSKWLPEYKTGTRRIDSEIGFTVAQFKCNSAKALYNTLFKQSLIALLISHGYSPKCSYSKVAKLVGSVLAISIFYDLFQDERRNFSIVWEIFRSIVCKYKNHL